MAMKPSILLLKVDMVAGVNGSVCPVECLSLEPLKLEMMTDDRKNGQDWIKLTRFQTDDAS